MMAGKKKNVVSDPAAELRALLEAAVDGIITISDTGVIVGFNSAAERIFGYGSKDVEGRRIEMLMPEPDCSRHAAYIERYLTEGQPRIIGKGREVTGRRSDGSVFPMWLSVGEAVTEDHVRRFVGIVHDLTDRHEAERERRELEARVAHVGRLSLLGEMAAGIAHEINQPLSAIATYSEAAKRVMSSGEFELEELKKNCDRISEQAHRAGAVINNLRAFLKKQEVRTQKIDLNAAIEDVMPLIEADANAAGIPLHVEFAENLAPVEGNPVQLQQVILNLTRNAVDAMTSTLHRDRGLLLRTRATDGQHVTASVIDHGPGVAQRIEGAIFHPFFTTKSEGLGVGLAISKSIIEAHSGRLSYRPNPRGGSIFDLELPVAGVAQ